MHNPIEMLQAIHPLSPALLNFLESILRYKLIPKGQHLLKEGHISQIICFIEYGLLRCYKRKGDNITNNRFSIEGDICFAVQSFYKQIPSDEYIQALEPTAIWYISREELEDIFLRFPEFNFHGRVLIQQYHLMSEKMMYPLRLRLKAERYKYLKENFPKLMERVPMIHLASYLQTSAFTLSRIKNNTLIKAG